METSINTVQVASLLIGTVLPIVVGIITSKVTAKRTKALALALLSAVSGFLTEYVTAADGAGQFHVDQALLTWLMTFVVAVAVHYGFWRPVGVSARAQAVGVTAAGKH